MVFTLIRLVKLFELYLNSSDSKFKDLNPRFKAAGSIIEGTRLGAADELDLSLEFGSLKPEHFEISNTALKLSVTQDGKEKIKDWLTTDNCLDMVEFLKDLLDCLQTCLEKNLGNLPKGVSLASPQQKVKWEPCQSCQDKNREREESNEPLLEPRAHCRSCIPNVALSKAGPCLVFKILGHFVSVDIIPIFPSPVADPVKLYNLVTQTLINEQPYGWQKYLDRFMSTDRILPESLALIVETEKPYICMKVLNFNVGTTNFILRPGQILAIDELKDEKLKAVYCYMKGLKTHFDAKVKSYFLKKVLLLEENLEFCRKVENDQMECLFQVLNYPMLRKVFEKHIDYESWSQKIDQAKDDKYQSHFSIPVVSENYSWPCTLL